MATQYTQEYLSIIREYFEHPLISKGLHAAHVVLTQNFGLLKELNAVRQEAQKLESGLEDCPRKNTIHGVWDVISEDVNDIIDLPVLGSKDHDFNAGRIVALIHAVDDFNTGRIVALIHAVEAGSLDEIEQSIKNRIQDVKDAIEAKKKELEAKAKSEEGACLPQSEAPKKKNLWVWLKGLFK